MKRFRDSRLQKAAASLAFGVLVLLSAWALNLESPLSPGIFLASSLWPQGVHSDLGQNGVIAYIIAIFALSVLFWSALFYAVVSAFVRPRRAADV